MKYKPKDSDYQNDWAYNDDFTKELHISEAKSGLNGYYCLGCKREIAPSVPPPATSLVLAKYARASRDLGATTSLDTYLF